MARGRTRGGRLWTCIVHKPTGCVVCAVGIISAIILPGKLFHQAVVSFQSIILVGGFFSQLPRVFNHYSSIILVGKIFRLQRTNQSFYRVIILVGRYCMPRKPGSRCEAGMRYPGISGKRCSKMIPDPRFRKSWLFDVLHTALCWLQVIASG